MQINLTVEQLELLANLLSEEIDDLEAERLEAAKLPEAALLGDIVLDVIDADLELVKDVLHEVSEAFKKHVLS